MERLSGRPLLFSPGSVDSPPLGIRSGARGLVCCPELLPRWPSSLPQHRLLSPPLLSVGRGFRSPSSSCWGGLGALRGSFRSALSPRLALPLPALARGLLSRLALSFPALARGLLCCVRGGVCSGLFVVLFVVVRLCRSSSLSLPAFPAAFVDLRLLISRGADL